MPIKNCRQSSPQTGPSWRVAGGPERHNAGGRSAAAGIVIRERPGDGRAENVAGLLASGDERERHLRTALIHAAEPSERIAVLNNLATVVADPHEAVALARKRWRSLSNSETAT